MIASSSTTVNNWLRSTGSILKHAGIATARLDTLVLLEDSTGKDRGWLLAHPNYPLSESIQKRLDGYIKRRAKHIPLAYIRGKAEFYGREFIVNAHTLVPRPETEAMIDMLKYVHRLESDITGWEDGGRRHASRRRSRQASMTQSSSLVLSDSGYKLVWESPTRRRREDDKAQRKPERLSPNDEDFLFVDIGTGSGAIAITAKLEFAQSEVIATDIDEKCLQTARTNAHKLDADITLLRGNLLEPISVADQSIPVLLCNLPYVPDNFQINTAASHEPRHALFGGSDGLELYRELFSQIQTNSLAPTYIVTESMPPQHEALAGIAGAVGYRLLSTSDFIQLFVNGLT